MDILKNKTTLTLIIVATVVILSAVFLLGGPAGDVVLNERATAVGTISITLREPASIPGPTVVSTGYVTLTLDEK